MICKLVMLNCLLPLIDLTIYEVFSIMCVAQRCAKIYCNIFPELLGILILEYPREIRIIV